MSHFYVACDLNAECGRVVLGTLSEETLSLSEVRRFQNLPIRDKDSLQWNIPQLYQETLAGLRAVGAYEEAVDGISCDSWAADYLLFESDSSLITPTYHHSDPRSREGMQKVLSKVTQGVHLRGNGRLADAGKHPLPVRGRASPAPQPCRAPPAGCGCFQFSAGRRPALRAVAGQHNAALQPDHPHLVQPAAKLSGFAAQAAAAPRSGWHGTGTAAAGNWQEHRIGRRAGDRLLLARDCRSAGGIARLSPGESWAYLQMGSWTVMGTELAHPIITDASRALNFTNEVGFGGSIRFSKQTVGLWILEECRRFWKEKDREIDDGLLTHLAGSSPPFDSLINPTDPRFLEPGDMPLKIQAFCRETNQPVPRKPGPIIRCVMESLALQYRKTLQEIEDLTGRQIARLYLLGGSANALLKHFIANAVRRPLVVAPADAAATGNVIVQALALGHLKSLEQGREFVRNSFKTETLVPYATAWDTAYARLTHLCPA